MQASFQKSFSSLDSVFTFVGTGLDELQIPGDASFAAQLAIEELFTNMVKYGSQTDDEVEISLQRDGPRLVVVITEHGDLPFDPTSAPDVDVSLPLAERNVGGLGIHLVRSLIDEITYSHGEGRNCITLIKNLEP